MITLSLRQLQGLDEDGIVSPEKYGHKRFYSINNILALFVFVRLRDAGVSLRVIKRMMRDDHVLSTEIDKAVRFRNRRSFLIFMVAKNTVRCMSASSVDHVTISCVESIYPVCVVDLRRLVKYLSDK